MCRVILLLIALRATHSIDCSVPAANALPVRDAAAYAFYSSLYRQSDHLAPGEILGIAAEPMRFHRKLCSMRPSTEEERNMVEAAKQSSTHPLTWNRQFDLGRPYLLIPPAATTKAIDCIGQHHGQAPRSGCEPYAQLRYVRFLSVPIFNADHTRALVAIDCACGGLCGKGSVQVYRKTGDGWQLAPNSFARCGWVA